MSKPGAALAHADGDARTRVRWSSRAPFRRIAAILTSLALGAGLAVVGVAAPASAHHNTITATASCAAETGTFDITWKVENSENRKETITASSNKDLVPVGTELGKREVKTFVQKGVPGGTYKLDLSAKWDNGATQKNSGGITLDAEKCGEQPTKKIEYCHATSSAKNPYTRVETSVNAFFTAGHIDHERDIWPAFTYRDNKGKLVKVAAQGDQSLLQYEDCVKPPTKIAVPAEPQKTDKCGVDDDRIIQPAATTGVVWTIGKVDNNAATATAKTLPGFVFDNGKTEQSWKFTFTNDPCPVVVTVPAKPAKVDECGVALDAVIEPKSVEGVSWVISPIAGGKATATATTKAGFVFADGTTTKTWNFEFNTEPCVLPAPLEPKFIEQCGLTGDALELPAAVDHVSWNVVGDPKAGGLVTVTAVAAEGYAFPAGSVTSFTHTFTDEPCPPTIITFEGVPTMKDVCGADDDAVVLPPAVEHMSWQVSGDPTKGGLVTVTAVADKGYAFGKDVQTVFPMTFDSTPCPTEVPVPAAPNAIDTCGLADDKVDLPKNTDQVHWSFTGTPADGPVIVTATAQDGFVFPGDVKEITFEYEFDDTACVAPSLKGSVATGICEADSPWIFFDVELTDPDKQSTGNTATLVMTDGTNTETIELGELENGSLQGKVLWPGASVDADGKANGWPGWALVGNKWIEVDDNFAWTRGDITATLEVNPELDVAIAYPPATPNCAIGPKVTPPGGGEGGTPAASNGTGLASTGFAGTSIAIVAGIIVIAGLAFLVVARIRRKRA